MKSVQSVIMHDRSLPFFDALRRAALWGGVAILAADGTAGAQVVTIAAQGQPALGEPTGIEYISFGFPVIAPDGTLAFGATVGTSPTKFPQTQIAYAGPLGAFSVLARQGDPALGAAPGVQITSTYPNEVADGGFVVAVDSVQGAGIGNQGIFAGRAGSYVCYASQGQSAPGGGTYTGVFFPPSLNAADQFVFRAGTTGPLEGIYFGSGGVVSNVADIGQSAPGTGSMTFMRFHSMPALSDSGQVVFAASAAVPGGTSALDGIWSGAPGSLQLVLSTQTVAPGTDNAVFSSIGESSPSINRTGRIAFRGGLVDQGPVNNSNDSGIWSNISGPMTLIARQGDQASGLPSGTRYTSFSPDGNYISPVLNDSGRIAFGAGLVGDGNVGAGLFAGTPGHIQPILLAGQRVPGLPASISLNDMYNVHMNEAGQMVFMSDISGPGVVAPGTSALLAYDPVLGVRAIAVPGQVLSGVGEAVTAVAMVGDNAGYLAPSLSDTGVVTFSALFPSGPRILETTVPEPSAAAALLILIIFGWRRSRLSRPGHP